MRKSYRLIILLSAVICCFQNLNAQLGIKLMTDRKTYVKYEPIYAKLQIRNYSGKTIVFGETEEMQGKVSFIIQKPSKSIAEPVKKQFNSMIGTIIPAGGAEEVFIPLNRLYYLLETGGYACKAIISHKLLSASYESNEISFNIVNGDTKWEKLIGVPELFKKKNYGDEPRTAKLMSFHDGTGNMFCLLIEDKTNVYGLARLGYDIGGAKPECEVDGLCRIHILIQANPNLHNYFCYDINCKSEETAVYIKTETAPTLLLDPKTGSVMVVGGRKAVKDIDYIENEAEAIEGKKANGTKADR